MNLAIKTCILYFPLCFKQTFLLIYIGKFTCALGTLKTSYREAIIKFGLSIERQ